MSKQHKPEPEEDARDETIRLLTLKLYETELKLAALTPAAEPERVWENVGLGGEPVK